MQKHNQPQTKQFIVANQCPMSCGQLSAVLCARPSDGSIVTWWSRCQRCLTYWETSPAGKITVLKMVQPTEHCPECLVYLTYNLDETANHVCAKKSELL